MDATDIHTTAACVRNERSKGGKAKWQDIDNMALPSMSADRLDSMVRSQINSVVHLNNEAGRGF